MAVMVEGQGKQDTGEKKQDRKPWTLREFGGKTVWAWLDLLLVPLVLGIVAVVLPAVFNWQQDMRQNDIENRRAQADRKLAERRAEDEALQAYLNQMNTLLLEHDLRNSKEDSGVRTLARARTITVLGRLDPSRKTAVMQFLVEADLVQRPVLCGIEGCGIDPDDPIIRPIIRLSNAELSEADLSDAELIEADLSDAELIEADLRGAILSGAVLHATDLSRADLSNANLSVIKSAWSEVGVVPRRPKISADLSEAVLRGAILKGANLKGAYLDDANLSQARLEKADLSDASLNGADLEGARGVTDKQLGQAEELNGATMPDGQKYGDWLGTPSGQSWIRKYKKNLGAEMKSAGAYEDWIKTPEGKMWLRAIGEDGENSGPS